MKIFADIDIDVSDRDEVLKDLHYIHASRVDKDKLVPHNVGIYLQNIPVDPQTNLSTIPYEEAERRGYFKFDILNVHAYGLGKIKSEEHLQKLIDTEPLWEMLEYEEITKNVFQLSSDLAHTVLTKYKPKTATDLAICGALIRPGKQHLIGEDWKEIEKEIWTPVEGKYWWRKSHAIGYAVAIVVQLNLMVEES